MAKEFFKFDFSAIRKLRKALEGLDKDAMAAAEDGVKEAGKMIRDAQRQYAPQGLAQSINFRVKKTSTGMPYAESGYLEDAWDSADGVYSHSQGYRGTVKEYGVPGESPQRSGLTYKKRRKNGKVVTITKNPMPAQPHIRRGYDEKVEAACKLVEEKIEKAIDKKLEV